MANKRDLEAQKERLKLQAEKLNLRLKIADSKDRLKEVNKQLGRK